MFEVTFTFRDEKQEVVTKTKTLENWIELERLLHRIKTDYAKEYDNAFDVKEIKSL